MLLDFAILGEKGRKGNYGMSVHHNQNNDPLAYSSDYYLTLVIDSVSKTFSDKDSIELTLQGFDKSRTWRYGKQKP